MPAEASSEVHEMPLASRLIDRAIGDWLDQHTGIALAAAGLPPLTDYERGFRDGIDRLRHLHLDGYGYQVVPQLVDQLKRAGIITPADQEM